MLLNDNNNILIKKDQGAVQFNFRKKHEPSLYVFLAVAFSFICVILFVLIPLAKQNNPSSNNDVLNNIALLSYLVGGVLFIAAVHETLKREWMEINDNQLIIGSRIFNKTITKTSYPLKSIKNLMPGPPPQRGWKITEKYEDSDRKYTIWSKDIRKVYPAVCFQFQGKEVSFANGITPDEANTVIDFIKNYPGSSVYVYGYNH